MKIGKKQILTIECKAKKEANDAIGGWFVNSDNKNSKDTQKDMIELYQKRIKDYPLYDWRMLETIQDTHLFEI